MAHRITLKKYPNRRLYDTEQSIYVTLNDVADMVRQGKQVEVIDLKTNQDVTAFTLTQIIMEQTKKNNTILPVSLLHLIIRFGENSLSEFFEKNLEQIIRSYLNYKKNMENQFQLCLELGIDLSAMAEKTINQLTPFHSFLGHSISEDDENK
ncbi:PHB/PHA accumulation regulator DNA-binding domain-containing protein [Desulfonema limicola]|uniref:PHB/PHA accumulation regulator DNA-binding domain-containing protein n=1 Tax=Desulfonema limicola TaxID=45656 RepID=A0A975GH75_9BACT|nr:polyhydroxyalkanoate synthesis regulator DNA-binding domain-containing protein [Desulfonema limicola]QTA80953.1 PHB/PHA accumulation regulator DNA-binding domain-containing protein [Desulfonema limicola]